MNSSDLGFWQGARHQSDQLSGHYESWFLRANHPSRKEALWIRYTIYKPQGNPEGAIGELWAIHFDGEKRCIRAGKSEFPLRNCTFSTTGLGVKVGEATLQPGHAHGEVVSPHHLRWDLSYEGDSPPVIFLPEKLYTSSLPKAKTITTRPFLRLNGSLIVDGEIVQINDWVGSENHNWGAKHTDSYAWGQVVGFEDAPDVFLEAITAKLKLGPVWTPSLTILVLRTGDEEYRLNGLARAFLARGHWKYFDWRFSASRNGIHIHGHIYAEREDFCGLTYYNPPGGSHTCLNTKVATCDLKVEIKGKPERTLRTENRAAFEILTDDQSHGVTIAI